MTSSIMSCSQLRDLDFIGQQSQGLHFIFCLIPSRNRVSKDRPVRREATMGVSHLILLDRLLKKQTALMSGQMDFEEADDCI